MYGFREEKKNIMFRQWSKDVINEEQLGSIKVTQFAQKFIILKNVWIFSLIIN